MENLLTALSQNKQKDDLQSPRQREVENRKSNGKFNNLNQPL